MTTDMKGQHTIDQAAQERLAQAIFDAIGPNSPYPTPEEIAAHKQRGIRFGIDHPPLKGSTPQ